MGTIQVKYGRVTKRVETGQCGGKRLAYLEIQWMDFAFLPGTFLMIRRLQNGQDWAYPYMIASKTSEGFGVFAREDSHLYLAETGEELLVWGPSGRGVSEEEGRDSVLLLQESAAYLAVSLALAYSGEKRVIVLQEESQRDGGQFFDRISIPFVWMGQEEAAEWLAQSEGNIYAVVSPRLMSAVYENVPGEVKRRTWAFANTKIGCGVGACKGCVLHHEQYPVGIPVCCSGPFLPYLEINWKMDETCIMPF